MVKRWFRIRAIYSATALNLIVWGKDASDAMNRAAWWQKRALTYVNLGEVEQP